ncbi:MAG TPA: CDP-alcohol phosphatidyltransferase family protein [Candidatus Binataceae bacterium]|nr:CDP-alcohol phosphatidyltransferase family protein [Candidatus Binataceae bacterium]
MGSGEEDSAHEARAAGLTQLPNALSASRFVLAGIWIALVARGVAPRAPYIALVLGAWATDYLDGQLARRFDVASGLGRWLDAIADVTFVLAAIVSGAALGAVPYYIPFLIAASFTQYAVDSTLIARAGSGPIRSRLGHLGGMINYAIVIVLAVMPPPALPGLILKDICPLIAILYIAAMSERAWLLYRSR